MKMAEHIAYLKLLRIPFKKGVLRAIWHILNDHKGEIDIDDLIKATCVYQKPEHPRRRFRDDRRPRRGDRRGYRDRGY